MSSSESDGIQLLEPEPDASTDHDVVKSITLIDGFFLTTGLMFGSGIFASPGLVMAQTGSPGLYLCAWVISGAIVLLGR
jgi:hypothetical protein